ncbi:MAG: hypothetical protein LBP67_02830 [Bacteroidales bacterium]|nr:hypothetical protein [Bacteroidales bacterium]
MNIVIVSLISFISNIILGRYRTKFRKMSLMWWIMIHASIPFIIPLRIWLGTPNIAIPLFIGLAIAGQFIGSRFFGFKTKENCEKN